MDCITYGNKIVCTLILLSLSFFCLVLSAFKKKNKILCPEAFYRLSFEEEMSRCYAHRPAP